MRIVRNQVPPCLLDILEFPNAFEPDRRRVRDPALLQTTLHSAAVKSMLFVGGMYDSTLYAEHDLRHIASRLEVDLALDPHGGGPAPQATYADSTTAHRESF